MRLRFLIAIVIILTTISCKTTEVNKDKKVDKKGKLTSNGFWIDSRATDMPELHGGGPFIRIDENTLGTVTGGFYSYSNDGGKTWKSSSTVANLQEFKVGLGGLVKTRSGVLIYSFPNSKEKANWNWQNDIHDSPGATLPTYAVRSIDNGRSWLKPQKLHDEWTGADRDMIETKDGAVVLTSMKMLHNPGRHAVITYTTKDDGETWIASNILDIGGSGNHAGSMESTLVQLSDGRLWMLLRTNYGVFWETFSNDDGLSWSKPKPTDIDASSSPGFLKKLKDGKIVLVWNRYYPEGKKVAHLRGGDGNLSAHETSWERKELSIMFSNDDGHSWSTPVVIARSLEGGREASYPIVSEVYPGKLWITTTYGGGEKGGLKIALNEADFVK